VIVISNDSPAVHEIAVRYEIADCPKNPTSIISRGYFRVTSIKQNIDLRKKLKINSLKWKFTLDYDIIQGKLDIRESR
jgi:hypothetical protein